MPVPDLPSTVVGPGAVQPPEPGARRRVAPGPQGKDGAGPRAAGASSAGGAEGGPARPGRGAAAQRLAAALSNPAGLERAVATLAAEDRLPPRGSLIDLRV